VNTSHSPGRSGRRRASTAGAGGRWGRVARDDQGLATEGVGDATDEHRVVHGRGVDAGLVGAGQEQRPHVLDGAHAPADGQRQEDPLGGHGYDVNHGPAPARRGGDVEKTDLVRALPIVFGRDLDRIAGVAQLDEADALLHAAGVHVEAGDDPAGQH
jgi:hypothetical protein